MASATVDGVTYVDLTDLPQDDRVGGGDVLTCPAAPGFGLSVTKALCR